VDRRSFQSVTRRFDRIPSCGETTWRGFLVASLYFKWPTFQKTGHSRGRGSTWKSRGLCGPSGHAPSAGGTLPHRSTARICLVPSHGQNAGPFLAYTAATPFFPVGSLSCSALRSGSAVSDSARWPTLRAPRTFAPACQPGYRKGTRARRKPRLKSRKVGVLLPRSAARQ
jgi:hypothetical protein